VRRARGVLIGVVALCPAVFVAGSGCSSSSSSSGDTGVDPGGVFGAEVTVTVIGRGRVTTSIPGVNCPGICTSRFVYKSSADPGAANGVTLKAITTNPSVRFAGWKFEPTALGTRGRGPENCNPVVRDSAIPAVDTNNPEINLQFGTTSGRSPAGQEGACTGYTEVPTAYNVTATFVDQSIVDAGSDVTDGDANNPDVFFESPVANAVAKEIGFISPYLYWRWDVAGNSGVAYAQASALSTPQVIFPAALPSTQPITVFNVASHVVFQTSDNVLRVVQGGGNFPVALPGAPACVAVASDLAYVYCRTAGPTGQILQWTVGGSGPTVLYNDVPTGTDLWADPSSSTSTYLYFSNSTAGSLHFASKSVLDGGAASFFTLTTSQTTPYGVVGNGSRVFWMNGGPAASSVQSSSNRTTQNTAIYTTVPLQGGPRVIAPDTSATYVLSGGSGTISRHYYTSTLSSTTTRTGLPQINGLTMDSSTYVYWTQNDGGRVYRAIRQ
jgi:hypothetical protein